MMMIFIIQIGAAAALTPTAEVPCNDLTCKNEKGGGGGGGGGGKAKTERRPMYREEEEEAHKDYIYMIM
jgi:hypothetical protein